MTKSYILLGHENAGLALFSDIFHPLKMTTSYLKTDWKTAAGQILVCWPKLRRDLTCTSKGKKIFSFKSMCYSMKINIFSLKDNIPQNKILAPFHQNTSTKSLGNGRKQNSEISVPWLLAEWQRSFPKHLLGLSVLSEWVCELWELRPLHLKEQGFSQHQSLVNNQLLQSQSSGVRCYSGGTEKGKLKNKKAFSHLGSSKTNALQLHFNLSVLFRNGLDW